MNRRREKKNQVGGWLHRRPLRGKNKVQDGEETQITKSQRADSEVERSRKNQVLLKLGGKKMNQLGKKIQVLHQMEVVGDLVQVQPILKQLVLLEVEEDGLMPKAIRVRQMEMEEQVGDL